MSLYIQSSICFICMTQCIDATQECATILYIYIFKQETIQNKKSIIMQNPRAM